MNDFSNIPSESEFRDEMTIHTEELVPDIGAGDMEEYGDEPDVCPTCGAEDCDGYCDGDCDLDESMDGDFDSGMASAGFGTDEDYGYYGGEDY